MSGEIRKNTPSTHKSNSADTFNMLNIYRLKDGLIGREEKNVLFLPTVALRQLGPTARPLRRPPRVRGGSAASYRRSRHCLADGGGGVWAAHSWRGA